MLRAVITTGCCTSSLMAVVKATPSAEAQQSADDGDDDALHQELGHDVEARGAQGLARAHLTNAFVERGQQDVHDDDAAHEERDGAADEEGDVVDLAPARPSAA